jgi:hypothetical protein
MAQKFLTNVDLNQNQLINATFEKLGTDPTTGNFEGRLIYNTTTDTIKVYTGAAFKSIPHTFVSGGGAGIAEALSISESNGTVTLTLNVADTDSAGLLPAAMWQMLTDATSDATASKLIKRDGNGNAKVATPTDYSHIANKGYVDSARQGLDVKQSVRVATTAPINIATDLNGGDVIDGVTLVSGDRVLVKNQSTASENGIYQANVGGPAPRTSDADGTADTGELKPGTFTFVEEGTANSDKGFVVSTNGVITVGSSSIEWTQFSGAGSFTAGDGLSQSGNTINVNVTANRTAITADAIDIASTYVGQSTITTLGTITTGTWDATTVAVTAGGTGVESFTDNGVVYGNGTSALDVTSAGTEHQVLRAGSGGVPAFGAVDLSQTSATTNSLLISRGGTNASTEATARTNLAAGGTQGAGVSTPSLARKVTKAVGNGVDTSFTVVHAFNTREVMVQVYDSANYDTVIADIVRSDANTVTVSFSVAPSSSAYTVIVIG